MREQWMDQGFVRLGALVHGQDELDWLVGVADELVASGASAVVQDLVGSGSGPPRVAQVMAPGSLVPELNNAPAVERARAFARQYLGEDAQTSVAMVITKPAFDGGEVPWHQDAAYWEPDVRHAAGSIWIALQDVDEDNGCLRFVPASHKNDVLEHQKLDTDPTAHALHLTAQARDRHVRGDVAVPLGAGEATLHDAYLLHASGPNRTDRVRRAMVLSVRNPARNRPIERSPA